MNFMIEEKLIYFHERISENVVTERLCIKNINVVEKNAGNPLYSYSFTHKIL